MRLKVLGSGSKGNCYLLYNGNESLMLEAGVPFHKVLSATGGKIDKIKGCLVTHEHGDHAKYIADVIAHGIKTYMTPGTIQALADAGKLNRTFLATPTEEYRQFQVGGFQVLQFWAFHDAKEPAGYLIGHEEMGTLMFATDTCMLEDRFDNLSNIMIECNHDEHLLAAREDIPDSTKDRIRRSHMSIDRCIDTLLDNDLQHVNNIILIHLSEGSGDPEAFAERVGEATRRQVHVATSGYDIEINKHPF